MRRRFVITSNAKRAAAKPPETNGTAKHTATSIAAAAQKLPANGQPGATVSTPPPSTVDLTETIKTLLHLAQEHGYITYDDINDILPDNLSPDDLDALLSKLRSLDVEIVMDQAEAERSDRGKQPQQAEEVEDDSRLEILDDPVRMYMNQMGKVPLLTREQEVEICKKIEEAEVAMKSIIYGLGFTAKEHIAIAEKLLSEPPKERFDRVIVDKKVANREGHLRDLRKLIKKLRAFDQKVDEKYFSWQKSQQKSRKEQMQRELKKMSAKLQEMFGKFYYKQKVVEEMIVVAGNIYDKFQASTRHIQELESQRTTTERRTALEAEHAKIQTLEQFVRMPREEFYQVLQGFERCGGSRPEGQDAHGRGQFAPRRFRREKIHQPRPVVPRFDPGRQHRLDERRRKIRVSPRLQIFHLRDLVDSPGHHALDCGPGAHDPHPGAHD